MRTFLKIFEFISHPGILLTFFKWPIFSFASYTIVSRLKKFGVEPRSIVDIGANAGQFSVASLMIFKAKTIFVFEPNNSEIPLLNKNLKNFSNVQIENLAITDFDGFALFNVNSDSQVSSLLELGKDREKLFPTSVISKKVKIKTTKLDSFFKNKHLSKPILLKIDVQGAEDKVIRGGKKFLKDVQWIVIEVSFSELYKGEFTFNEINNLLQLNKFKFVKPLNLHYAPDFSEIIEMDLLFVRDE